MTSDDPRASTEHDGSGRHRSGRRVSAVLVASWLLGLHVTVVASLFMGEATRTLERSLQAWSDVEVSEGSTSFGRAVVTNVHSGRILSSDELVVQARDEAGAPVPVVTSSGPSGVHFEVPVAGSAVEVTVEAGEDQGLALQASWWIRPSPRAHGLPSSSSSGRGGVGASSGPRVVVGSPADGCARRLEVTPDSGVAARMMTNRLLLRLTEASGEPVVGVPVRVSRPALAGAAPVDTETGAGGLARVDLMLEGDDTFTVRFPCPEAPVERAVTVYTSGDGVRVRLPRLVVRSGEVLVPELEVLRRTGSLWVEVVCDGDWVLQQEVVSRPGVQSVRAGRVDVAVAPDEVRLCAVQVHAWVGSSDPPRSAQRFVVAGEALTDAEALEALGSWAWTRDGAPARSPLGSSGEDEVSSEALVRWVLAALPQPFVVMRQVAHTASSDRARLEERRGRRLARLGGLLVLDVLLLLVGLVVAVARARRLQRARLEAALADDDDDDGGDGALEAGLRASAPPALVWVGVVMIVGFLVSLGGLLLLLARG